VQVVDDILGQQAAAVEALVDHGRLFVHLGEEVARRRASPPSRGPTKGHPEDEGDVAAIECRVLQEERFVGGGQRGGRRQEQEERRGDLDHDFLS